MILSFKDKTTNDIYNGLNTKLARHIPQTIWDIVCRKLDMINSAYELKDLMVPPGNKLERLHGALSKYYSIRINNQFRIIFIWKQGNAEDVQITDYH